MDSLSSETTIEGVEEVFANIRSEFADEKISPEHFQRLLMEYDMIKSNMGDNMLVKKDVFDQTNLVLESEKELPMVHFGEFTTEIPSANVEAMQTDENGYEWFTSQDGTNFYRTIGSQADWTRLEN